MSTQLGTTGLYLSVDINFPGASTTPYLILDDTTRGQLDTNTLAGSDVLVDVSGYVRSGSLIRGSNRVSEPIIRYEPGTATITLDNQDRRFDPTNLAGPYVAAGLSEVAARRAIRLRATYGAVTYDLYRGFVTTFDVKWPDPGSNDSTTDAICSDAFALFSKVNRVAVGAVGAGETTGARITRILNSIGWPTADRTISTGDSTVQATTLEGDPAEEMQLVADTELGELYMGGNGKIQFRNRQGLLEDFRSAYTQGIFDDDPTSWTTGPTLNANSDFEAGVTGWVGLGGTFSIDSTTVFAGTKAGKIVPDGVTANAQIQSSLIPVQAGLSYVAEGWLRCATARLVDLNVNWFDAAFNFLGATLGPLSVAATTWTWFSNTVVAPAGAVWANILPTVPLTPPATDILWADNIVFRSTVHYPYQGLGLSNDDSTLYNQIQITIPGGTLQQVDDLTSQSVYGAGVPTTYARTDLILQDDATAKQLAQWLLYQSSAPELRFTQLVVNPLVNPAVLFPAVLERRLGDRITIIRRPPGGGSPIQRDVFIRGIQHDFSPSTWLTTFTLQDAFKGSFLVLDNPVLGKLNSNALAY
jgi:hypothetical protein